MKSFITDFLQKLTGVSALQKQMKLLYEENALRTGQILEATVSSKKTIRHFGDVEFKVFSQWGDDGIIYWLTQQLKLESPTFVEFGVQTYEESNTRYLLQRQNARGLVLDGNPDYIHTIQQDPISWKHQLNAKHLFITQNNIDSALSEYAPDVDLDLLSIDIDGNDYWVMNAIRSIRPKILICEYNSLLGQEHAVTIPYQENFIRSQAHFSNLYFGASIQAVIQLAEKKGYRFLGTNTNGNNAYFVRNDLANTFIDKIQDHRIFDALFRESRSENGELNYLAGKKALEQIGHLPLTLVQTGQQKTIQEIYKI